MYRKKLYIKYFAYTGDVTGESATTRLLEAVKDDDIEACREALENGANVKARYNNGRTLIEMALLNNDFEMVKMLVEHDANVSAISEHGEPMLATAIEYGDIETVKYLIEHGANVNAQNRHATLLTLAKLMPSTLTGENFLALCLSLFLYALPKLSSRTFFTSSLAPSIIIL